MSSVGTFSFPSFMANRTARENRAVSPGPQPPKCPFSTQNQPRSRHRDTARVSYNTPGLRASQTSTFTPNQPVCGNAEQVFYPQIGTGVWCKNGGGGVAANQLCCSDAKWVIAPQISCAAVLQHGSSPPQNGLCCNDATWATAPQIARAATMQKKKGDCTPNWLHCNDAPTSQLLQQCKMCIYVPNTPHCTDAKQLILPQNGSLNEYSLLVSICRSSTEGGDPFFS